MDLVQIYYGGSLATRRECIKQIHKKTNSYKLHFPNSLEDISLLGQLRGGKY